MVTCSNSEYLEREIKPLISKFLADRGLELSEEKTKITHILKGFDFLGFNVRKYKQNKAHAIAERPAHSFQTHVRSRYPDKG